MNNGRILLELTADFSVACDGKCTGTAEEPAVCLAKACQIGYSKKEAANSERRREMKFKERYLSGEIPFEEIDIYIEKWGNSDETCTLRAYLGLSEEEEDVWISDSDEALMELLDRQRQG